MILLTYFCSGPDHWISQEMMKHLMWHDFFANKNLNQLYLLQDNSSKYFILMSHTKMVEALRDCALLLFIRAGKS